MFFGGVHVASSEQSSANHLRFLRNIRLSFCRTYSKPIYNRALIFPAFSPILTVNSHALDALEKLGSALQFGAQVVVDENFLTTTTKGG